MCGTCCLLITDAFEEGPTALRDARQAVRRLAESQAVAGLHEQRHASVYSISRYTPFPFMDSLQIITLLSSYYFNYYIK